ncbi:MAG TPA: DUF3459 domain-containing protein, partial [Gemmatimonadales bacterium]|nr:DUF3459 domain-containing protein [Gemmatimonadales bacterium]
LDAVWSDDFHHQLRRRLAGDTDGYFADFTGASTDIASTIRHGWFYQGQFAEYFGRTRGSDPFGLPRKRFVFFIQNHDQVGNRALGERLHHGLSPASYRAASTLLLTLPETPLVFMGQEWGATCPFLYFTDHHDTLGEAVRRGRQAEFARFRTFGDPAACSQIPDPQAFETFAASRLDWTERERGPHRAILALYRRLLELRRYEPALAAGDDAGFAVFAWSEDVLLVRRGGSGLLAPTLLVVVRLAGQGRVDLSEHSAGRLESSRHWQAVLSTGDEPFAGGGRTIAVDPRGPVAEFSEPGAVLFRAAEGRD